MNHTIFPVLTLNDQTIERFSLESYRQSGGRIKDTYPLSLPADDIASEYHRLISMFCGFLQRPEACLFVPISQLVFM